MRRGFAEAVCEVSTMCAVNCRPGGLKKKATNRTANWKSYIPYKTPLIRTVKHGKKQLTPPRGLQSEAACLPLSRSGGVVEWWSGGVVEWWSGGVVEWWSEKIWFRLIIY